MIKNSFFIISLAYRNLLRNKRRTFLAVISVLLSVMFILFMKAFVKGFLDSMVINFTRLECGHIRITTKEFEKIANMFPVSYNIKDVDIILKSFSEENISKEIDLVVPRFTFGVLMNNNGKNKPAVAIAGEAEKEKRFSLFFRTLLPGSKYIEKERELIMGEKLAALLQYKIGDTVRILSKGSDDAFRMRKFVLVGIFKTNVTAIDERFFFINIKDAQKLLKAESEAQQIVIFIKDYREANKIALKIQKSIDDSTISVKPWSDLMEFYTLISTAESIYMFFYGIIALLGSFIISNIMMMVVYERRKEIGLLKSMGMKQREILLLFLTEGILMGSVGSLCGIIGGTIINFILSITGMDFTKVMSNFTFPMDNIVYPRQDIVST
ncbi:MAG: ABC transporter permease, partial [Chitinispirillaceae bacterium]|nr:ABC transporter permease [Chitinispirillaceae bacterium]